MEIAMRRLRRKSRAHSFNASNQRVPGRTINSNSTKIPLYYTLLSTLVFAHITLGIYLESGLAFGHGTSKRT
jgi:hypothetical protein